MAAKDGRRACTAQVMEIGDGVRIQVTIEDIYCCLGCLAAVVREDIFTHNNLSMQYL